MADKSDNSISLKALVDKGSNKIIFVESGSDFADVLFSFLTIPMGTIIRLGRTHSIPVKLGSMKNLYSSVEKMDVQKYWSAAFKEMLLHPKNAAEYLCNNLKLKIDNIQPTLYFACDYSSYCSRFVTSYQGSYCRECQSRGYGARLMRNEYKFFSGASQVEGVFVKEQTRLIVTDDLQVVSPIAETTKLFTQLGVMNSDSATEELTLNIGVDEVVNLLLRSLVSKTPLTDILLKQKIEPRVSNETLDSTIYVESRMLIADTMHPIKNEKIPIKLTVSKSKNVVCYAQAKEDFVNLLFSFLTLPLGYLVKQMRDDSFKGCIDKLYKTVHDPHICASTRQYIGCTDTLSVLQNFGQEPYYLKSSHHREMLLNPKLVPGFCYEKSPLGIEEVSYYLMKSNRMLTTDKSLPSNKSAKKIRVLGPPYSADGKKISPPGFLKGQAVFTVSQ